MTTKIPAELSSTPGIVDNSDATAITIDSSENVGVGTTSPSTFSGFKTLHFKNGSGDTIFLNESDGGVIGQILTSDSVGAVTLGARSNHDLRLSTNDTERMRINTGGNVTKPNQTAFWAFNDATMTNVSTGYTDVNMGGDRYDIGGNFNNSNGQFTAPVTGKYYLEANIGLQNIPLNADWLIIQIQTSNHAYNFSKPTLNWDNTSGGYIHTISCSTIADMDENDIAYVRFYQYAGTADTDIYGTGGNSYTYFCGYLLG